MDTPKRIDSLYRNCKQMPIFTLFGFVIPLFLLIGAPLGFVYAADRKKLLKGIADGEIEVDRRARTKNISVGAQIDFIEKNKLNFYAPAVGLIIYLGILALIIANI